jgi:antitoxin (DNA-binding transcriptional repressor) of toxin-antitoxin stability system
MSMSEPARDLPADRGAVPLAPAVDSARHGMITHLTVRGERVAAIVPESMLEALHALEDAEDAAEADEAFEEPGEDISWEEVKSELKL